MHSPLPRAADAGRRWAAASLVVQLALIGTLTGAAIAAYAADPTDEPGPVGPTAVVAGTAWADASETRAATGICVALLEPGSGIVVDAQVAPSGSYSFPAVAPDVYTLRFADCDASRAEPFATTYLGDGQRLDSAASITISPYVDVTGLDAHLAVAGSSEVTPIAPAGGAAPAGPAPRRPASGGSTSGGSSSGGSTSGGSSSSDLPTLSLPETTATPTPTPTPTPTATPTPTLSPTATATATATPDPSTADGPDAEADGSGAAVGWVVLGSIAALALVLAVVAAIVYRRRAA